MLLEPKLVGGDYWIILFFNYIHTCGSGKANRSYFISWYSERITVCRVEALSVVLRHVSYYERRVFLTVGSPLSYQETGVTITTVNYYLL